MSASSLKAKLAEYARRAHTMSKATTKIGVLGGNYEDKEKTPVAYVAAIQEYGSPAQNIPPRPFMRPTVAKYKGEWADIMRDGMKDIIEGRKTITHILDVVGDRGAMDMKTTISQVTSPPLSPVTIKRRMAKTKDKGKGGGSFDKPLEDTFTLFDSINHKVDE